MRLTGLVKPFLHMVFPLQIGRKSPGHALAALCDKYTTQGVGFSQLPFNHLFSVSGADAQCKIHWPHSIPIKNPGLASKCNHQTRGSLPQLFPHMCTQSKANLMPSTLLTGCHNYHPSISQWFLTLMMSSWQILLYCNFSLRMSGCPSMAFPICALSTFA